MYSVLKRLHAVSAAAMMLAAVCPQSIVLSAPVSAAEVKYIALTFDDGPNTTTTGQVLDILEEYDAKASFFLIGNNINEESAKNVKRAYDMGCEIDNHSQSHSYMSDMSEEKIKAEIEAVNGQIYEITGTYPSFFRPPYISVSAVMYDAIDLPFICGAGCEDWEDSVTAEMRAEKVLSQAQDGQIILMHDAEGNNQTVEALKTIIPELQKDGYQLVTLNELFAEQGVQPDEDSMYSIVPRAGAKENIDEPSADTISEITIPEISIPQKALPDTDGIRFVKDMRLGWNLGNTLDAYDDNGVIANELDIETYWNGGNKTTKKMIDTVKAAGFNTVRVPVSWHNHVDADFNISKAWMDRVQEVVDYAVANDLYVILNVHHDNDENTMYPDSAHYESSSKYMTSIWKQIAERFQEYSDKLIFETMNEPRLVGHTNEWWLNMNDSDCIDAIKTINKLNQDCVDVIRASGGSNASRYIAVPGYDCSADGAANEYFELPKDTAEGRMIVAVHAYLPYGFALAEETDPLSTDSFQIEKDTKDLEQALDSVYDKFVAKGIPVYIGEFAALDKNGNLQARVDWAAYYAAFVASRGMACCWWDAPGGMMLLNRADCTWKDPIILQALNKYTGSDAKIELPTVPAEPEETGEIVKGKVSYDSVNQNYQISLPKASNQICLNLEFSDEAKGGASGCIANGFMKDGVYYWAMVQWKAKKSGEIVIDIDKDLVTLAYTVDGEDLTADDPELIAEAKKSLQSQKNFQAQVWWVGDASYASIDTSNVKITEAYIRTLDSESAEIAAVHGDTNCDGFVDISDAVLLARFLAEDSDAECTKQGHTNGDVNQNGSLDADDIIMILKSIAKLVTL